MNATHKALPAVHGTCRWLVQPLVNGDGILLIGTTVYLFHVHRHHLGHILGYRLTPQDDGQRQEMTCYDLPADLSRCECYDALSREDRPGGCKHRRTLAVAIAALKTPAARNVHVF